MIWRWSLRGRLSVLGMLGDGRHDELHGVSVIPARVMRSRTMLLGCAVLLTTGLLAWLLWGTVVRHLVSPTFGQCEDAFKQLRSSADVDRVRDACRARDGTTPSIVEARIVLRLEAMRLDDECEKELAAPQALSPKCERFFDEADRSFTEQELIEEAERLQRAAR